MRKVVIPRKEETGGSCSLERIRSVAATNRVEEIAAASQRIVEQSGYGSLDHYLLVKVAEFRRRGK